MVSERLLEQAALEATLKIRLLGTGAADGIPGFFSQSRVSAYARAHGGKDIRTRSSAIVDDTLKIDFPPDTFAQVTRDKLDPSEWTGLVFTHSHDDHFASQEIQYALYPFTDRESLHLTIYGNHAIVDRLNRRYPLWPIEVRETKSFEPFQHLDYTITPMKATHQEDEDSQNLILQKDDLTILYATDTGVWEPQTWEFLSNYTLDGLIIECTEGFNPTSYIGHLSIASCVQVVHTLRGKKILSPQARVVTTHHAHQGDATHGELVEALAPHDIEPGFDGMVLDF